MSVADTAYTWRVRPVDVKGNKGPWTDLAAPGAKFFVVGDTPVLSDPGIDVNVSATDALFSWQPVAGATSYKFERQLVGNGKPAETVTTPALAYAPRATISDGAWEWRVSALDAAGKVTGSSSWRPFLVDGTAPSVASWRPQGTVKRGTNFVVTFSEPVTSVNNTTFRLRLKGSTTNLLATVTLSANGRKATLNPTANLKSKKAYVLSLTRGITDVAGNPLTKTFSWKVVAK